MVKSDSVNESQKIPVILVVDDNPQNLQLIGGMLGDSQGFDLSFATSGREALDIMESILPDLVLLDVNMPGMSGFEVCRRMRESEAAMHIPVIFLTAQGETEYIVQGLRAGGSDYVVKPFEPQELLAPVRVQLELHWSRMEMKRLNEELRRLNDECQPPSFR
jgi:DNA-binding response OmpR family regulator